MATLGGERPTERSAPAQGEGRATHPIIAGWFELLRPAGTHQQLKTAGPLVEAYCVHRAHLRRDARALRRVTKQSQGFLLRLVNEAGDAFAAVGDETPGVPAKTQFDSWLRTS